MMMIIDIVIKYIVVPSSWLIYDLVYKNHYITLILEYKHRSDFQLVSVYLVRCLTFTK